MAKRWRERERERERERLWRTRECAVAQVLPRALLVVANAMELKAT